MQGSVNIRGPRDPVHVRIGLPPAKSVANRALILADLAGDLGCVQGIGQADDTRILHDLLARRPATMPCGDGGTTLRFLLAWASVQEGTDHLITGNPRLLQRPHGPLVKALRALGADITETKEGYRIRGKRIAGGKVGLHAPQSSQYISALLLVAGRFTNGLQLDWTGTRLSEPYVHMTVELCRRFGVAVQVEHGRFHVQPGGLKAEPITVPGDWSAAAFWYQIAATRPGSEVTLGGLVKDGLQGDEAVADLFRSAVQTRADSDGIVLNSAKWPHTGLYEADLTPTPDLFQPLAFALAATGGEARLTGLHNLPLKETDRLKAVADALQTLGCTAHYDGGSFHLQGPVRPPSPPPFDPRGDHRMAMSLAPMALVCEEVTILHPGVVNKSYPGFWNDLERAGFRLEFH